MIQRIQSVYLLLGGLLLSSFVVLASAWTRTAATVHASLPWAIYVLSVVDGLIGFVAVVLYKDRQTQVRVIAIVQWLDLALILVLVAVLGILSFRSDQDALSSSMTTYAVLLMPVASYILFGLARRAVSKDIELVRSADRLR